LVDRTKTGVEPPLLESALVKGYDYNCQPPSDLVTRYESAPLPDVVNDGTDALIKEYVPEIAPKLGALLAFGVIACIWLTCWSCGMMGCCVKNNCLCAKCCGEPMKCTQTSPCNFFMVVFALALAAAVFGVGLAGWRNNKTQNDAVVSIGSVFDIMSEWASGAQRKLAVTETSYSSA
jgi:hypothetical protein